MKMIVPVAIAALLALGACSQAGEQAAEPASTSNAASEDADAAAAAAAAVAPAAPAGAGLAKATFVGLPQSCQELADRMDYLRGCTLKILGPQLSPEEVAEEAAFSRSKAEEMAAEFRNLPAGQAVEACKANHELLDQQSEQLVRECEAGGGV